ncbi:hypothetical protein GCM10022252_52590 [Streptosporangium oxazolinicum]|uniref:MOSC domain-containing protein n=1 Tax=Streptosporangium oxazolinicum TaxID=909287 RepID=A0ABP8B7Q4_9ACTN
MNGARLERVVRYPLKGFGGEDLEHVVLRPGAGLPYDRFLAVANGRVAVRPDGDWTPSPAFVRLAANDGLPLFGAELDPAGAAFTLTGPDRRRLRVSFEDPEDVAAANAVLAGWFPSGPGLSPRLVRAAGAYWDHEDANVSLINLETVEALSAAAGQPLDPMRFRANLYLGGLPAWEEFALVGRRIRVGEAELEVLRPTDRCRATSVDPGTAAVGPNVPALLGREFGHGFCGVYARVVRSGRLDIGSPVGDLAAAPRAACDGAAVADAAEWPRPMRIVSRVRESRNVVSLWLRDPLAGLRRATLPGQYVRVHGGDGVGPLWRSYTVSAVERDLVRISVRRLDPQGRMSRLLHSGPGEGDTLLVSGPFGDTVLTDQDGDPLLLVSAGIGITPVIAMLRACVESGTSRPVTVLHGARSGRDLALWEEAGTLVRRLPRGTAGLFLSRPGVGDVAAPGVTEGRIDRDVLRAALPGPGTTAYVCGPVAFMREVRAALVEAGAASERIHYELFASPAGAGTATGTPPLPGPFDVDFAVSGVRARWTPESGTLLDLAEAAGLTPPSACRSGTCRSCAQAVSGGTAYLAEPLATPPAGSVLLCGAVPVGDLTVQC